MLWTRFLLTTLLSLMIFSVTAEDAKLLTLREAILLSLRYNANVRTAELERVVQKFALNEAKWNFQPHYSFTASNSWNSSASSSQYSPMTQTWSAGPGVSWNSPIGTTVAVTNSWGTGGEPSLGVSITQPLIQGFGRAVVEAALENAYDTEKNNKLALKNTIMTQVTSTISAYMNLVQAENSVDVDQEAVDRAKTNLFQTKLYIQAGQNPRSDEVQAQSQVAQALAQLQTDKSTLTNTRYQLLETIGLDPTSNIQIVHDIPLERYKLMPTDQSIKAALENNVTYQTNVIGIATLARAVMTAEDKNRWTLNLIESYSRGSSAGAPTPATTPPSFSNDMPMNNLLGGGINNILNNHNYSNTISLNLTVPIDNMPAQDTIVSAKIALEQAEINLKQAKQNLILQVMSTRDSLVNSATQITLDENQVNLDKQTLENTMRSYRAGMDSSYQVTQQSQTYANDQRSLVQAKIAYFNALASFDQLYGHTLETWGIHVQY